MRSKIFSVLEGAIVATAGAVPVGRKCYPVHTETATAKALRGASKKFDGDDWLPSFVHQQICACNTSCGDPHHANQTHGYVFQCTRNGISENLKKNS